MRFKMKKIAIIIFWVLFLDDLCRYITSFIALGGVRNVEDFGFFYSQITTGTIVIHYSAIFLLVVMVIYFVTHFFKDNEKNYN